MKVTHRVELGGLRTTIDRVLEAVARFSVPETAAIYESEDSYDIVIEWTEGDE